eukprot:GILJ01027493.1.p1 GENE.GILJ01027493.1~~GILJ01027493.1.p1  ORF type:complete len:343 (-),score=5.21 GILJ01027493.1:39-1067(-)
MIAGKESSVGSIDAEMMVQLMQTLTSKGRQSMKLAMSIQFYAALRFSELVRLRPCDIQVGGIVIQRPKTHKAKDGYKNRIMFKKLGLWQAGQAALRLLKKASIGKSDNSILFPRTEWNARAYNAEIKAAAVRYGWQESVRFRGSLSLRHGGVAFAAKELEGKIPLQEIASLLEMSITNYYRYRASNQERAMADEVGKENRKSWLHTHRNVTAFVSSTCQAKLRTLLKEDAIYTSSDSEEEERGNIKAGANPRGRVKEKSKEDINTGVRVTRPTLDRLKSWIIDPSKRARAIEGLDYRSEKTIRANTTRNRAATELGNSSVQREGHRAPKRCGTVRLRDNTVP